MQEDSGEVLTFRALIENSQLSADQEVTGSRLL